MGLVVDTTEAIVFSRNIRPTRTMQRGRGLYVSPVLGEVMIMFLNRIREWNYRRLEKSWNRRIFSEIRKLEIELQNLSLAIQDPNGLGMASFRMRMLHCPEIYEHMLCAIPEDGLVIDGGANLGLFSDLMLGLGAKVVSFEPNPILCKHLVKKYHIDERTGESSYVPLLLKQMAISIRNEELPFSMSKSGSFISLSQGGNIENVRRGQENLEFKVKAIDFIGYLEQLKIEAKRPYLIKLDIEGAEFDVLNGILDAGLNDSFDYMVCETHERFFEDGDERINQLKRRLESENVNNIFLDWA